MVTDNTNNQQTYYEMNKDKIKDNYLKNSETLIAYQKDYNLLNHDKYIDYQRKYYEQRKEELLRKKKEKVMCNCGKMVSLGHLSCHKKTNLHLKKLSQKKKIVILKIVD